jgi:hypothetical protein
MIRISPSGLESAASCLRKFFFKNFLRLPVQRSPWQELGVQTHRVIERYSLYGEEPPDEFSAKMLQLVKPFLQAPPYPFTEVECWVNRPASTPLGVDRDTGQKKPNKVVELPDWAGRTDFEVHLYTDYWPDPDGMGTWDWKQRADTSFKRTPKEDLRDDPQALMYQLLRSVTLTGTWEEPGEHAWHVLDRKVFKHEKVAYAYSRGEALERWKLVCEPLVDLMQEVYGSRPSALDPAAVPATGYAMGDDEGGRECDKWGGCDFAQRCMAAGTPVYGIFSTFLTKDRHKPRPSPSFLSQLKMKRRTAA